MYTPDRGIVAQLKREDPDLGVRWDRMRERWVVTCMGKDAVTVQEDDGAYRPLDGRIVSLMRKEAWEYRHRYGQLHMLDSEMHARNRERRVKKLSAQQDDFRQYMVEDGYRRVVGVGSGGGSSMFNGWAGAGA